MSLVRLTAAVPVNSTGRVAVSVRAERINLRIEKILALLFFVVAGRAIAATCPFSVAGLPQVSAANDGLALIRHAVGLDGAALANGISVAPDINIKAALTDKTRFLDIDGDTQFTINDALIIARYQSGFAGDALVEGITFDARATRRTAAEITAFFVSGCGIGIASTSDVFIAPAGPLCAARDAASNACLEPTSSSATVAAVSERITAGTDRVQFTAAGAMCDTRQMANVDADRIAIGHWPTRFTQSSRTCDLKRETLLVGASAATFRAGVFPYFQNEFGRPRSRIYKSTTSTDKLFVSTPDPADPDELKVLSIDAQYDYSYRQTGSTTQFNSDYALKRWVASPALLTDTQDAPIKPNLIYNGGIYFAVGDASPLGDGEFLNLTGGSCPIVLKFDKVLGEISGDAINCQGGVGAYPISLSFKRLYIKQSRVFAAVGTEMTASITGSATPSVQANNGGPSAPISVQFASTKIDGAVYGVNASYLYIVGTGPNGDFTIQGFRSDVPGE
jgi:hypothetical protein